MPDYIKMEFNRVFKQLTNDIAVINIDSFNEHLTDQELRERFTVVREKFYKSCKELFDA